MSTIENYKTLMDNSNRGELRSIIKQIEAAPDIPYVDRQGLLGYGYYKMDFFEDAFQCAKNIITYNRVNHMNGRIELPHIFYDWWLVEIIDDTLDSGCADICGCCCSGLGCAACLGSCSCNDGTNCLGLLCHSDSANEIGNQLGGCCNGGIDCYEDICACCCPGWPK